MNDQEFEEQKARLERFSGPWVKALGLSWWRIDYVYDRTGEDFVDSLQRDGGFRQTAAARCYPDWRYGIATVKWNMPEIAHLSDERLEEAVVHEFMHCFLSEMVPRGGGSADFVGHEERVATTLQKAFIWLRDAVRDGELVTS